MTVEVIEYLNGNKNRIVNISIINVIDQTYTLKSGFNTPLNQTANAIYLLLLDSVETIYTNTLRGFHIFG